MSKIHEFEANLLNGSKQSLQAYEEKVLLIVNTASHCGFTPQYAGLQNLYEEFKDAGLVILGFPCNQFGGQEPGGPEEIQQTCQINYGVDFPVFEKIEVNGDGAHPLFQYLKESLPGIMGQTIKWNFTKFLVDRSGKPIQRYAPTTKPEALRDDISEALGA